MIKLLFGGWQGVVLAVLLAGAVGTLGYYVYQYDARGREIVELRYKIKSSENEITVLKANKRQAEETIEILNQRLQEREGDLGLICELLSKVEASTDPGGDGPVGAPVDEVLERLKQEEEK